MKTLHHISAIYKIQNVIDDLIVSIQDSKLVPLTRLEALVEAVKGKSVLHLGCCDHINLIDKKITDGTWLHSLLSKNAKECYGVDINKEAVEYLCSKGYRNIYCADITKEIPPELNGVHFDIIILGEILEHINDPIAFLATLHKTFVFDHQLIITVPNAFFLENFKNILGHFERINSDHRYWFTPYTIAKICFEAGYWPDSLQFVFRGPPNGYGGGHELEQSLYHVCAGIRDVIMLNAWARPGHSVQNDAEPKDLDQTQIARIFCWDSSVESLAKKSLFKQALIALEQDCDTSALDNAISEKLKQLQLLHTSIKETLRCESLLLSNIIAEKDKELFLQAKQLIEESKKSAALEQEFASVSAKYSESETKIAALRMQIETAHAETEELRRTLKKLRDDFSFKDAENKELGKNLEHLKLQHQNDLLQLARQSAEIEALSKQNPKT